MAFFPDLSSALLSSASSGTSLPVWAGVGAIAGVFLFVQGFRMLRLKRIILNTPASKVRSASMGLVEVSGVANGPSTIPAGLTGEACFYYRAVASQLKQSGKSRTWQTVADERLFIPFFVEDTTGGMLVNSQGADLDLHCNFKDELSSSFFSNGDMVPENVSKFLARHGIVLSTAVRLQEWCIKPSDPLFVLGTLGKRMVDVEWSALPHSPGTRLSFSFGSGLSGFSARNENKLLNASNFIPLLNIVLGSSKGTLSAMPATKSQPAATPARLPRQRLPQHPPSGNRSPGKRARRRERFWPLPLSEMPSRPRCRPRLPRTADAQERFAERSGVRRRLLAWTRRRMLRLTRQPARRKRKIRNSTRLLRWKSARALRDSHFLFRIEASAKWRDRLHGNRRSASGAVRF